MKPNTFLRIVFCIFTIVILSGCGYTFRSEIRGRVIDAETEKPVEGAAFAIHWFRHNGCCMGFVIADSSGYEKIEVADGFTKADGSFTIPEYSESFLPPTLYDFGVYKKGYVVWNRWEVDRWDIYDDVRAGKRKPEEMTLLRQFELKDGMVIRLEPWKEGYSAGGHSYYLDSLDNRLKSLIFDEATREERRKKQ